MCPTASDGHFLEVLWCPVGKGDPKWQAATSRLFLGIDHTAIGRPTAVDLKANDLVHWQIHFVVSDAEMAFSAARGGEGGADQSRGRGPDGWRARLPPPRPRM